MYNWRKVLKLGYNIFDKKFNLQLLCTSYLAPLVIITKRHVYYLGLEVKWLETQRMSELNFEQ